LHADVNVLIVHTIYSLLLEEPPSMLNVSRSAKLKLDSSLKSIDYVLYVAGQHCRGLAQSSVAPPPRATRRSGEELLRYQIKQSFLKDEEVQPDPRPVLAGVLLERYPICFPHPSQWKLDYEEWSLEWNAWKYRQVPDEMINADKQGVDETSDVVCR
jgi:hypothetical protein